jgi:hypothetical protein
MTAVDVMDGAAETAGGMIWERNARTFDESRASTSFPTAMKSSTASWSPYRAAS